MSPNWLPDGRRIIFSSDRTGEFQVYVMRLDDTQQARISRDLESRDNLPVFSTDGKKMAFTSVRDGNPGIYVMNADGTDPARLTEEPEKDSG